MAESPDTGTSKPQSDQRWFRDVTIGAHTLRTAVLLIGGLAIVLLSVGVATALFGVQELRNELAELRAAIRSPQAGGRPTAPPPPPIPSEPVSLAGAQLKGSPSATVGVLMFSDFECPFCSRFALSTYADLVNEYLDTGKVVLAFRHLPLDQIHPNARKAAEAAECAGKQGKFWEMHDRLFLDPSRLSGPDLQSHATAIGLERPEFDRCLAGEFAAKVAEDVSTAARLQVYGTPAFLLGTVQRDGRLKVVERLSGAQRIDTFRAALDRLLQAAN